MRMAQGQALSGRLQPVNPASINLDPTTGALTSTVDLIEYDAASPAVQAVYDDIRAVRQTSTINNFWKALAHNPAQFKPSADLLKRSEHGRYPLTLSAFLTGRSEAFAPESPGHVHATPPARSVPATWCRATSCCVPWGRKACAFSDTLSRPGPGGAMYSPA
jgi:hypothetical protein